MTCFGGSLGIQYEGGINVDGSLSGDHCKKFGDGKTGKCLAIDLPKREARLSLDTHWDLEAMFFFPVDFILFNDQTA